MLSRPNPLICSDVTKVNYMSSFDPFFEEAPRPLREVFIDSFVVFCFVGHNVDTVPMSYDEKRKAFKMILETKAGRLHISMSFHKTPGNGRAVNTIYIKFMYCLVNFGKSCNLVSRSRKSKDCSGGLRH